MFAKLRLLAALIALAFPSALAAQQQHPTGYESIEGSSANVAGSYCMAQDSGTMAAGLGAAAPIYSFRYNGTGYAIVRSVQISAGNGATAFAAGFATFDMFVARQFTASDSSGTPANLAGDNGNLRTSFPPTGVVDLRIANTATLTAGTRVLDATQLGAISTSTQTTAGWTILSPALLFAADASEQPLQLAPDEGFVIEATVPATGTWKFSVTTCWDEVNTY